jgi:hypothetical protein
MPRSVHDRFKLIAKFAADERVPVTLVRCAVARSEVKCVWIGKRLMIDTVDGRRWLDELPNAFDTCPPYVGMFRKREPAGVLPFAPRSEVTERAKPAPERSRPPPGQATRLRCVGNDDNDPPKAA